MLIDRIGWKATKLYAHYMFEQERLKKYFLLMNQHSTQTTKISVGKNIYKLLNNFNFGNFLNNSKFDFRNNPDNCTFVPTIDELNEMTYLKKYYSLYDQKIYKFVSSDLTKQDAKEQYNDAMQRICKDDPFREIKVAELNNRRNESLETAEAFDKKTKKITDYWRRAEELMQNNKTKSMIQFDSGSSIKSVTMQINLNVKITTRFMKGKELMFTKTLIISFVYDMVDVFCFPEENRKVQAIYDKHKIAECLLHQNLIDIESTSLFLVVICTSNCQRNEKDLRNVIFGGHLNIPTCDNPANR